MRLMTRRIIAQFGRGTDSVSVIRPFRALSRKADFEL